MTAYLDQFRFTIESYYKLMDVGIIKDTDRVELINGQILTTSPINSLHAGIVNRLIRILSSINGKEASITPQNPIKIGIDSEPEPDIVIAKFRDDDYIHGHPTPEDIYCLIEVSDSTLEKDRSLKQALYASVGIPEYWIINLVDNQIEIYRQPKNGEYHFKQVISENSELRIEAINLSIQYNQIFR